MTAEPLIPPHGGYRELKSFQMAEIIHDLDIRDDKYKTVEAKGLEEILSGIRKSSQDDTEALEKGMTVFEMIYVSKSR